MAVEKTYLFHSIQIRIGAGTTTIGAVESGSVSNNPQFVQDFVDGNPYPSQISIRNFTQDATFGTKNVAAALGAIGTGMECIQIGDGVDLFYAQVGTCNAGPLPGNVHRKISIGSATDIGGKLVFQSLNTAHREDAIYSFQIIPEFDGVNFPFVITDGQALPVAADTKKRFTLGPMTAAGKTIEGKTQVNIDGGVSVERLAADSSIFDEFVSLQQGTPRITTDGYMGDWFTGANLGLSGNAAGHADTKVVLRQYNSADPSGFFPNTDAEHVTVTGAGLVVASNIAQHSGVGKVTNGFTVECQNDGVNTPLVALSGQTY